MASEYRYPEGVENKLHLEFTAADYKAPKDNVEFQQNVTGGGNQEASTSPGLIEEDKVLRTIRLYIPGGFGDSVSTDWSNENVIPVGGAVEALASVPQRYEQDGIIEAGKGVWESIKGLGAGASDAIVTGVFKKGMDMMGGVTKLLGDVSAEGTIAAGTGRALAPNEILTFKGTSHAALALDYNFLPNSEEEVIQMMDIIDFFRDASRPVRERKTLGTGIDAIDTFGLNTYKYPPVFDIKVFDPNKSSASSGSYFRYKFMVLTSFAVNYGNFSDSMTYFRRNVDDELSFAPTDARMSLSFQALYPNAKSSPISRRQDDRSSRNRNNNITFDDRGA